MARQPSAPHRSSSPSASFSGPLAVAFARQAGTGPGSVSDVLPSLLRNPEDSLPAASAADRSVWGETGTVDRASIDEILKRGEADLAEAWPHPRASDAARVHSDGDRVSWEDAAFHRQRRLSRAVIAAAVTDDDRWYAEVLDGVWLLCEQSSWCWPAHDDVFGERGAVLATKNDPYLDLGAGEVVGQLAWLDHIVGAGLERRYPGSRARIRREARTRVLDPFVSRRDWHWLGLDGHVHNWNPWIHGNVLVAALRLLDDPAEAALRAEVVALTIEGVDRYVAALPADGAIDEGYAYWWNGACRALEALEILTHATGGVLDAAEIECLRETVAFPHRMHLGGAWYLNLADGPARPPAGQPWHSLHRAARRVGDRDAEAHAAAHRGGAAAHEADGLGRLVRGITDRAWVHAAREASPLPRDVWLSSTQVLLSRGRAGTAAGLTLAVKAGNNGENHNHNDVGSFVVASDGVPVIVDAGRPTYTAQTFGPDRYEIWTMQSGWHNVPVIDGLEQSAGAQYAAAAVDAHIADARSTLTLDGGGAYPGSPEWTRVAAFERDPDGAIVMIDDVLPTVRHAEVRMLIAGDVTLGEGMAHITPLENATPVRIRWAPAVAARLVERELDDPVLSSVWGGRLTRLDLLGAPLDGLSVRVELDIPIDKEAR